ncbi:calcium-binding protein [Microvirga roseola]|uniref:calcium-binding protein n=1 Tax=Microvirga roseola TaxID=2883126 RepID=UPI001E47E3B1|nr:calcium-binding protein [Microvirga roseola]
MLSRNALNNTIVGNEGANSLDGKGGSDVLIGGSGNDVYYVDHKSDKIHEVFKGGNDAIIASSYWVAKSAHVEVLKFAGGVGKASHSLYGSNSSNAMTGTEGANLMKGFNGNDRIWGQSGNDVIRGGAGLDRLYGDKGRDAFVFDTKLSSAKSNKKKNFDKISDFSAKDDTVWLENKYFKKLGKKGSEKKPAKLNKKFFTVGTEAKDKDDYLIYNKKTGKLYYDAGSGSKDAIEFAQLKKNQKMTYEDFYVI